PRRFLDANQQSISFRQAVSSPAAVGTPSMVRLMQTLHSRFGRLSWASSLQAAQQTAQQGFAVSPRLHQLLSVDQRLRHSNAAQRFYPNGQPLAVGTHYTNPAYAHHLVQLAQHGADWFYRGESAQAIVTALGDQQGLVSREDLSHYQVIEHTPICLPIERHHVCGVAGSSSGGVSVLQALKMLEGHWTDNTPERFTRLTNAQALAFADRNAYLADPDFVSVPFQQLLDPQYLKQRQTQALEPNALGNPTAGLFAQAASAAGVDTPNTSHISVVDQYGQAASLTLSIESAFGSQIWVEAGGFFLNNQLTDFSFQPHDNGQLVANRVQGGKRPRSSMSPTLVLDQSQTQVIGVIGSPGGSQIIGFVTHALWQLLNQQSVAQVLNTGHVLRRGQSTELESDRFDFSMQHALAQRGHRLISQPMTSGLAIIWRDAQGQWVAGADPRREGTAQLAPSTKSIPNQD
ncbi:MAG: gamma-glutamyltransferase, partial [Pseudomonadota bacterium]|nr:gamma-glutamyltransferase [Pseudomonadota bacterium]